MVIQVLKISQQGSFYAPFGFAAALPVGFYYADQYLFDGYLTDKVTDIYNSTIDYLFGTNKQSSTLSKKMIADNPKISGQQGANNPMEYYEDPINMTGKSGDTLPHQTDLQKLVKESVKELT